MWMFYAFLSAIMAALVAIFAKLGLKDIDTTLATTIRAIVMVVFLVVVSFFLKKFDVMNFSFRYHYPGFAQIFVNIEFIAFDEALIQDAEFVNTVQLKSTNTFVQARFADDIPGPAVIH